MQKQYKQVHQAARGYFFRITLPVAKFQCEERWDHAMDAAFFADVFKHFLVKKYRLTGNTMWPSLPPDIFAKMAAEVGLDRASLDSLTDALPSSCREFLLNGGNEELEKHRDEQRAMRRVVS